MSEQTEARDAIYAEITRQASDIPRTHSNAQQQAESLRDLAAAYAHVAGVHIAAEQAAKASGNSRVW